MIDLFVCDVLHLISVATTILPVQELVQVTRQLLYAYTFAVTVEMVGHYFSLTLDFS